MYKDSRSAKMREGCCAQHWDWAGDDGLQLQDSRSFAAGSCLATAQCCKRKIRQGRSTVTFTTRTVP